MYPRQITLIALLFLFAAPVLGTMVDNGDGTFTHSHKAKGHKYTSFCVAISGGNANQQGAWLDGTWTCQTTWSDNKANPTSTTTVVLGMCSQQEYDDNDPLPVVACNAAQVTSENCLAGHQDKINIPKPAPCRKLYDFYQKGLFRTFARNGLAGIEQSLAPVPVSDPDDVTDP